MNITLQYKQQINPKTKYFKKVSYKHKYKSLENEKSLNPCSINTLIVADETTFID